MQTAQRHVKLNPIKATEMLQVRYIHDKENKFTLCYDRNNVVIRVSISLVQPQYQYSRRKGKNAAFVRHPVYMNVGGFEVESNYNFVITREELFNDVLNHPTFITFSNHFMANILDFDMISGKLLASYVREKALTFISAKHKYHKLPSCKN
jgi:hypothetical protein